MIEQNGNQLITRTLREYAMREIPDNPDPWPQLRSMTIAPITNQVRKQLVVTASNATESNRSLTLSASPRVLRARSSIVMAVAALVAIVIFLGIYGSGLFSNSSGDLPLPILPAASTDSQQLIGLPAPDATLIDVSTGGTVKLSFFRGKAVLLNTWGTRCTPCLDQLPRMQQVYEQYKDKVQFVSISFGPRDTPARIKPFLDQNKYPWTFLSASAMDEFPYDVEALPTNYFISSDGIIRAVFVGSIDAGSLVRSLDSTLSNR